jgi:hypothetical protein
MTAPPLGDNEARAWIVLLDRPHFHSMAGLVVATGLPKFHLRCGPGRRSVLLNQQIRNAL